MPYMTEPQRLNIEAYFRHLADLMGLSHWEIHLVECPSALTSWASIAGTNGRLIARVKIAHGPEHGVAFWEAEPEQQRHLATHELTHLFFENAWQSVELDLAAVPGLSKAAHEQFRTGWARQMEYGIDAVAAAWAPNLPLPTYGPEALGKPQARPKGNKQRG